MSFHCSIAVYMKCFKDPDQFLKILINARQVVKGLLNFMTILSHTCCECISFLCFNLA